uniref:Uncharacterized protein n=1 Tax=Bosea sp. NBC_00436 TaxID=2969620 RepID=A0A9E7ZJZ1_9HYPH
MAKVRCKSDMTLGVADDMRNERISFVEGDLDWLEESALIDRSDIANKNAAAAAS